MTERQRIEAFAKKLLEYVDRSGKSHATISKDLGVSPSTFSRWCNGTTLPSWEWIRKLAAYFDVASVTIMERRIVHIPATEEDIFEIYVSTNPNSRKVMELTEKIDTMNKHQLEALLNYANNL